MYEINFFCQMRGILKRKSNDINEEDKMEQRLIECLQIALKYNVTDIHFNIQESDHISIEMRIDGSIYTLKQNENDIHFFRYLMYRANLDVSNLIEPQTGQFEISIGNQALSLRFSVVSSIHVMSGVLRILSNHIALSIQDLTHDEETYRYLKDITNHRNGLFLFSGPTGSGKTTTLYTILNEARSKKIFTLEDPIEVYSKNYVQIQINEKQGMSYSEGIKQLMRQDPDIIMIGEIRDQTAAQMAVRTALTGHLVVSTIHASNCVGTIQRMLELNVDHYQLFHVLRGISNQRLYASTNNTKIGIYEIMNQKEIEYYEQNNTTSNTFIKLSTKVSNAIANKEISESEGSSDRFD